MFTNTSGMAINPVSFKQLPYDPTRDFTAVALVCNLGPQMLSVNADLPVATVSELIAYAKSDPASCRSSLRQHGRRRHVRRQAVQPATPTSAWSVPYITLLVLGRGGVNG